MTAEPEGGALLIATTEDKIAARTPLGQVGEVEIAMEGPMEEEQ